MGIGLPVELSIKVKLDCGQVRCGWPLYSGKLSLVFKRTKAARKFRFWNRQFGALKVSRSIESHQVNTTCLIISELWLFSLQELVHRVTFNDSYVFHGHFWGAFTWEKGKLVERERRVTPHGCELGTCWPTRMSLPGNTGSACLHLLFCSFNDFCFLIGLMSLSLVLRVASYFKLVPFHSSSFSSQFLQPLGWVILTKLLNCYILRCFHTRMYQKVHRMKVIYSKKQIHTVFHLTLHKQRSRNLFAWCVIYFWLKSIEVVPLKESFRVEEWG